MRFQLTGSKNVGVQLGDRSLASSKRHLVLLSNPADFETWLSGSAEEAFKLARSYRKCGIVQSGSERKDLLAA